MCCDLVIRAKTHMRGGILVLVVGFSDEIGDLIVFEPTGMCIYVYSCANVFVRLNR